MIRRRVPRPVWGVVAAYLVALLLGTVLLALPVSSVGPGGLGVLPSLFTATSALSVTGLVVFDPGTVLTPFGQAVVLGLIQVGGLGVMVFTMLLGMLVAARVGLQVRRVVAQEATRMRWAICAPSCCASFCSPPSPRPWQQCVSSCGSAWARAARSREWGPPGAKRSGAVCSMP